MQLGFSDTTTNAKFCLAPKRIKGQKSVLGKIIYNYKHDSQNRFLWKAYYLFYIKAENQDPVYFLRLKNIVIVSQS